MSVRRFNGTSDELRTALGGCNLTGAFTIAVLARPQAADEGTFLSLWDATTERVAFGVNGSKQPRVKIGGTALSGAEIAVTPATSQWGIWVVTKAAGTTAPRWHHYGFDTGVWKHADDGSTVGNPVTQAGGTVRFGNGTTLGFEQADLAAPAVWTKVLSDVEIEALKTAASILGGWKTGAAGLWLFKQSEVTQEVTDSTGGGADQSARTGTTVVAEEPPIPYEGGTLTQEITDSAKVSDSVTRATGKVLVDSAKPTDTAAKAVNKPLADAVTVTDAVSKSPRKAVADAASVSDSLAKAIGKVVADSATIKDALAKGVAHQLSDSVVVVDEVEAALPLPPGTYIRISGAWLSV